MADAAAQGDNAAAAAAATTGPGSGPIQHPRSCVVCRQRKVKCDRQQPCSNCTRAGCACVYPTGRGRAPKRARRVVADAQLVDKLARLETIIQRLAEENGPGLVKGGGSHGGGPSPSLQPQLLPKESSSSDGAKALSTPEHGFTPESSTGQHEIDGPGVSTSGRSSPVQSSSIEAAMGRLVIDDKKSYYVSNPLWATMAQEIEELRDFLGKSSDDDDDEEKMSSNVPPQQSNTSAALFGYRAIAHSLQSYHPSLPQAVDLFAAFSENVVPLLRIFHVPTLSTLYWESIAAAPTGGTLDKNVEALIFAIYYAATVSLPPAQCLSLLGLSYEAAIERYRFAAEQAIARADLLTTQSVVLLQATTLFINALRSHDGSRVSWSLTTLVFQLAQTMGLHRDGTAFGLKPFETEMRRRLWWHICILDSRSSDHHGFGPMLYHSLYDTRIPLNVRDEDLSPDMTEPPRERDEATEMCFCLVRCEAMKAATKMRLMAHEVPTSSRQEMGPSPIPLGEQVKVIKELEVRLQERYIRHCNPSSPIQLMATLLSRLIVVHFWLITYYPLMQHENRSSSQAQTTTSHSSPPTYNHPDAAAPSDSSPPSRGDEEPPIMTRDQLFDSSVEILQVSAQIINIDPAHKWSWYSKIHIQWHIVAFVLSEICRRPPSPACERAWAAVVTMYTVWNVQSGATPGLMWKSVRRLMVKARYMREVRRAAAADGGKKREDENVVDDAAPEVKVGPVAPDALFNPPAPLWNSSSFFTAPGTAGQTGGASAAQLDFHQGLFGMVGDDDPFMDMLDFSGEDLPMGDGIFGSVDSGFAGFLPTAGGLADGQSGGSADGHEWTSW